MEFNELKKEIGNLEFHECKDFLEMAQIIKSSRFFGKFLTWNRSSRSYESTQTFGSLPRFSSSSNTWLRCL